MKAAKRWAAAGALALLALPLGVSGQAAQSDRLWSVDVLGGGIVYPDASALEAGPLLGLEALYSVTPRIAIGPTMAFVRTKTDGSFFVAALDMGADSTRVFQVGQRVAALHYGIAARVDLMPGQKINPYLAGGAGGYTLYLNPQANDGTERFTKPMFQAGGGVRYAVTEAAGIRLDVRDVIYTDYDRDVLNPIRSQHRNCNPDRSVCRFPGEERSDFPDPQDVIHNLRFTLALTYVPGLSR